MTPNERKELLEFQKFMTPVTHTVPNESTRRILNAERRRLVPGAQVVFAKLFSIHLVFGTLSLGICNQFGLNPFNTSLSLAEYFMTFGHSVCMTLCGTIFLGGTILVARILLSPREFLVLRRNVWLQLSSLALLSLAVFIALGAHMTLGIAMLWLLGALVGGSLPVLVGTRPAAVY